MCVGGAPLLTPDRGGSFNAYLRYDAARAGVRKGAGQGGGVTPLVLHLPHASDLIPEGERADFKVSEEVLLRERLRLTDWHTDGLFARGADPEDVIAAEVSRLVVDVERFEDDAREPCARVGMGVTYALTTDGLMLRDLSPGRREALIAAYYRPHHRRLDEAARERLTRFGRCLVLDAHSFPSRALPTQTCFDDPPEIGLGTEPGHTPPGLLDRAERFFRARGFKVGVNVPFAGAMVPSAFLGRDGRVSALMVEVRRDLYLDESTGLPHAGFVRIREVLTDLRAELSA